MIVVHNKRQLIKAKKNQLKKNCEWAKTAGTLRDKKRIHVGYY